MVVAIDYFTKWVDAKPPASMTRKHIEKFVWEHIVCRFGIPNVVISDNRKQFAEGIFLGIEQRLGRTHQGWVDELPQVLWAHRTTPKFNNKETPFSLVYGSEAVVPIEISVETQRIKEFKARKNEKKCREDLNILEEKREIASIREAYYKQKLERYYNKRVRLSTFKQGTYVLILNSAIKAEFQGKIGPTWEGPYVVKKAYGDEAYKLETLFGFPVDRTWNGSNLHKFYSKVIVSTISQQGTCL
uniref:Reverse transcriptase domain-containing protein n=1 Tax=Tanacetum cinerariifolium TaxID=118510 RepID=A0A699GQ31_TANCI|nr:reverse transcriptase domain-containing protein [Tanacetum cinerariifolium]